MSSPTRTSLTRTSLKGWAVYAAAWLVPAVLWALAAALQNDRPPLSALPYGLLSMGVAATMGVGVWRLTGVLSWTTHRLSFIAGHTVAASVFAVGYGLGLYLPEMITGSMRDAWSAFAASPLSGWSLMMGSWLYLIVAGLSYSVRDRQRLAEQMTAEAEARSEARRAQLMALRARLNPHFLFNALHSVSAMIHTDPAAADEALDRLGGLLRYVLDEADDWVSFDDEWRFAREYLAIEQLRLGDRLRVHDAIAPDVMTLEVPALLLQPLIENAVHHGIAPHADGGTVTIRAARQAATLRIEVIDDGVGELGDDGEHGIGLGTVRERLQALYDGRATLHASPRTEGGFGVVLTLPLDGDAIDDEGRP